MKIGSRDTHQFGLNQELEREVNIIYVSVNDLFTKSDHFFVVTSGDSCGTTMQNTERIGRYCCE